MHFQRLLTLSTAIALGFAGAAQAATIVKWDGSGNDIVPNGSQNIAQETTFTTATFQSPTQGADYYPASAQNLEGESAGVNFYAAKDNTAFSAFTVFNGGGNDLLGRVQVAGATSGTNISSMLAWDFDAPILQSIAITDNFNEFGGNATNGEGRFLFQDSSGDWHASTLVFDGADSVDVASASWVAYTPHIAGVASFGAATTPDFTGVQRVGYYQEFDTTGGGGVFAVGFEATGVPEPTSLALLGLAGLGLVARRLR